MRCMIVPGRIGRLAVFCLILFSSVALNARERGRVRLVGSIQSDILFQDEDDDAATDDRQLLSNTYVDLMLYGRHLDAGTRIEYMEHPLPGYESDFKGWGVPSLWVKGRLGTTEVTAGSFYEQFGSGMVLRIYENRSLGIDNSLTGGRIVVRPAKGFTAKLLSGRQRRYWSLNDSWVSGADLEVSLGPSITLGGSWVNKYEKDEFILADERHRFNLPEYVNAWDVRGSWNNGPWSLSVEYAGKSQDPSFDNGYSYGKGSAAFVSGSFSRSGMSILLQGKRSENMSFRSKRSMTGISSFINYMPAFTHDQTYALAALYPYSTQMAGGELAWQTEIGYNFRRNTVLGGKYGMNLKVDYSHIGWEEETYYEDLGILLSRKWSNALKLNVMYMRQRYNMTVVQGHGGMVDSDIYILDGKIQVFSGFSLRTELQYLNTDDDEGDWKYGLVELSLAPHWMFSLADMYNAGVTREHYCQGSVSFSKGAHRVQLGYGRTRAGYNCSGGVCRYVPETKGVTVSYNCSF